MTLISLVYWVVLWLLGFALLPYGKSFYYLFFDIAVPIWVVVVFAVAEGDVFGAFIIAIIGALQLGASALEFGLRLTLVTRPFVVAELLEIVFVILSFINVIIWIWFSVAALRNYMAEAGREQHDKSLAVPPADVETPGGTAYASQPVAGEFPTSKTSASLNSASVFSYSLQPRTPMSLRAEK